MLSSRMEMMTGLLCDYGRWGAGLPSCHGSYEPSVPQELSEAFADEERKWIGKCRRHKMGWHSALLCHPRRFV